MVLENIGYILNESAITGFTDTNIINENNGRVIAEGILQTADVKNRNQRIYPRTELFPALQAPRILELLEAGYLRAELGHPLSTELVRQQTIDDSRTCAQFLKIWTEGDHIWGRFRGTNNAFGEAFNKDLLDGCKPAWSLRALGTISKTDRGAEVHNLKIITWDQVIYPSHPDAYTQRVVTESAMTEDKTNLQKLYENSLWFEDSKIIKESAYDLFNNPIPITNSQVIDMIKRESKNLKLVQETFDFVYDEIRLTEAANAVELTSKDGTKMIINLERHIHNEIMNYCDARTDFLNSIDD